VCIDASEFHERDRFIRRFVAEVSRLKYLWHTLLAHGHNDVLTGIAFDGTGRFGSQLLVAGRRGDQTVLFSIDCRGRLKTVTDSAPPMRYGAPPRASSRPKNSSSSCIQFCQKGRVASPSRAIPRAMRTLRGPSTQNEY
jgi:hypothetical protein